MSTFGSGDLIAVGITTLNAGNIVAPTDNQSTAYTLRANVHFFCATCASTVNVNWYTGSPVAHGVTVSETPSNNTGSESDLFVYDVNSATLTGILSGTQSQQAPAASAITLSTLMTANGMVLAAASGSGNGCGGGGCNHGIGYALSSGGAFSHGLSEFGEFHVSTNATAHQPNAGWSSYDGATIMLADAPSTQPVQCFLSASALAASAAQPTVTLTGGSPSPSTILCDGTLHNISMNPSQLLTGTLPADGLTTRFRSVNGTTVTITSCGSGVCPTFTFTLSFECQVVARANDNDPMGKPWGGSLTFPIKGTAVGVASTLGTISAVSGSFAVAVTTIWPDCTTTYSYPGSATDSANALWIAGDPVNLIENVGGTTRTVDYFTIDPAVNGGGLAGPAPSGGTPSDPISLLLNFLSQLAAIIIGSNLILYPLLIILIILLGYSYLRSRKGATR